MDTGPRAASARPAPAADAATTAGAGERGVDGPPMKHPPGGSAADETPPPAAVAQGPPRVTNPLPAGVRATTSGGTGHGTWSIFRAARFRGATAPPFMSGARPGQPFVAIEARLPDGVHPGDVDSTSKTACYFGRCELQWFDGTGRALLFATPDPGGDLGQYPLFCVELPHIVPPGEPTYREIVARAYRRAMATPEVAGWLRGPDGRGPAPPIIDVAPKGPNELRANDAVRWLKGELGPTP